MPSNHVANSNTLNVFKAPVGDEGEKYGHGLIAGIRSHTVSIERPLINKPSKHAKAHRAHFNRCLYLSEANISQT